MLMDFSSCPKKKNCMRKEYSKTCTETMLLTKYRGLKWEGQVKSTGRKHENIVIMVLGRFYSTLVIVVLIADTLLMEENMSEFSAPGDRYGHGRRGKVQNLSGCL